MKVYFVLLTVLHIVQVFFKDIKLMVALADTWFFVTCLGDIILFTLCLIASFELGFSRQVLRSMNAPRWRLAGQATLALGVFQTFLFTLGERIGAPDLIPNPGILDVLRLFLPYLLFAVPAVAHSHELGKGQAR